MLTKSKIKNICKKIFSYVPKSAEIEVLLSNDKCSLTRFANNAITQNISSEDVTIAIRVILNGKIGYAHTNCAKDESLKKIVNIAVSNAKAQNKSLAVPPDLISKKQYKRVCSFVKNTSEFSANNRKNIVGYIIKKCKAKSITSSGIVSNNLSSITIANSKGLFAYQKNTSAKISLTCSYKDGAGGAEQSNKDVAKIDLKKITERAIATSLKSVEAKTLPLGKYTVILSPEVTADLLIFMAIYGFSTLSYMEGRSFLTKKLNKKIFGENITIVDDAYHPLTNGLAFDFEGNPRKKVTLIKNGIVKGFVHNRKTAKKMKARSTGHALPEPNDIGPIPLNLVLMPGKLSFKELISSTKKGVLINQLHYTNIIDPKNLLITGMTRNGTFLVEDGCVTTAIKDMRFTQNLVELFSNIEGLGKQLEYIKVFSDDNMPDGFVVPAVKAKNFNFTSS